MADYELKVYDLTLDYEHNPTLAKNHNLHFAWKLDATGQNVCQTNYHIQIYHRKAASDQYTLLFDSGIINSSESYNVTCSDMKIPYAADCKAVVTVTDNKNNTAQAQCFFSTAPDDTFWQNAKWIKPLEHISGWAPYLRTKFTTEHKEVFKAVMYACGLGCAEYYVNGEKTNDYYIDPPMTNYEKTVLYRSFDVTDKIKDGGNCVCILLGEGFYSQSRVWDYKGFVYGDVCAIAKLVITYTDGTVQEIVTDIDNWKYKYSPITINNIYGGEMYDCRLETPAFSQFDSTDAGWDCVIEDLTCKGKLTPCNMPPVRAIRKLPAIKVSCASGKSDGAWIFDIGENIAGIAEYHLPQSPKGAVYVFRYVEVLSKGGENGYADHRSIGAFATQCIQQDIYIAKGTPGGEIYRPRFCYHGFRYIEITGIHDLSEGYGKMPGKEIVTGVALSTDFKSAGEFETSHADLNKLHKLMINTFRSNFHGFPEDCPAREKCGWLGDAQISVNWGLYNYESVTAYEKYLEDIRTTKEVYGTWQMIAPGKRGCGDATPLWGCAQIIIPYILYKYCADSSSVTKNMDLMKEWVEHELARSDDYIIDVGLGDWCPPGGNEAITRMPVKHSSTFMFYEICILMADLCKYFSPCDCDYYMELAEKIKESILRNFYNYEIHSFGYFGSDGVALKIGLYPCGEKDLLLRALLDGIKKSEYAMYTGIYANKYLVPALFENGAGDVALRFLFNKEKTSFGTMMADGATSIWEELELCSNHPVDKSAASYNHPMHGGFLYFCYANLAGFVPTSPGFATFDFAPCYTQEIRSYKASYNAMIGRIEMSYEQAADGSRIYKLKVPANCRCTLRISFADTLEVNGKQMKNAEILNSGEYTIICK
ncbi:MAG: family 78 glycoside hydrolase catalytic domain [Clostridia bacterium]|nr:family 78 glycoside hydrolase catalytic domain [Clostridia bacterium]